MAKRPLPTPEELRQLLRYEPETGKLFWRERGPECFPLYGTLAEREGKAKRWQKLKAGREAGSIGSRNYVVISVRGHPYFAHRIAWAIHHGCWPTFVIDHINGDRADNRLCNLRDVPPTINYRNMKINALNTSGAANVAYDKTRAKWRAVVRREGRIHNIGSFAQKDDAIRAVSLFRDQFGDYTERHGASR